MEFWEVNEAGALSFEHLYNEVISHTFDWDGSKWRLWAESNNVLVIERDGVQHRVKVLTNAKTYGNTTYQIMKTQVKMCKFNAAWLVAHTIYNEFDWWKDELSTTNDSYYGICELRKLWEIRPMKAA